MKNSNKSLGNTGITDKEIIDKIEKKFLPIKIILYIHLMINNL